MPRILERIEEIAIAKQRDVLYLAFHDLKRDFISDSLDFDYENCPARQELIQWLNQNRIIHQDCFGWWGKGYLTIPYLGEIYLDVPYDEDHPQYQLLREHLEYDDGTPKINGVSWLWLPLSRCMS